MLPNEFADASGFVLYKRFACRPKLIRDVKAILKGPWREAVILQGEPTIGKAKLVRWIAASLEKDFIYVQCTTASTVLRTLKEIIRQLERCHQQHAEGGRKKVKCRNAVDFIDGLKELCPGSDPLKCIVVDNVEHIAMNKELKVLMKAREYSDFQAHATIVLITDLCLSKTTFHPDLLHFSRIHFNQYTTAEAKEILASYCPVDGCEQSWTAFVDEYLEGFTLKSRHFESLKLVMQKAYAVYSELTSSGEEAETVLRDFYQRYMQMVLEFVPASSVPLE